MVNIKQYIAIGLVILSLTISGCNWNVNEVDVNALIIIGILFVTSVVFYIFTVED